MSARKKARVPGRAAPARLSSLDRPSLEAVGRFVRILARCGSMPRDIVRAVRRECERIPKHWAARARKANRYITDAAHVLTVWYSEASYLGADGRPRPLPLEGPSLSVEALVRSVDRELDARQVLRYLVRSGAVRRLGRRYVPRKQMMLLPGTEGPGYFRTLRTLTVMLSTLEHNVQGLGADSAWFEYVAENPSFPISQRKQLDKYVKGMGESTLPRLDLYMRRRETTRRPGEPTVRVGVGIYLWEDDTQGPLESERRPSSPKNKLRRRSR
jgi:hypothetical protein